MSNAAYSEQEYILRYKLLYRLSTTLYEVAQECDDQLNVNVGNMGTISLAKKRLFDRVDLDTTFFFSIPDTDDKDNVLLELEMISFSDGTQNNELEIKSHYLQVLIKDLNKPDIINKTAQRLFDLHLKGHSHLGKIARTFDTLDQD